MPLIALLAAGVTVFFVPPDRAYLGYFDVRTLACLFAVLAVVGALRRVGVFAALARRLAAAFRTVRGVCAALVLMTMAGSMLLTNDAALLTFLPLSWAVLHATGSERWAPLLFVLQNSAANLCGMLLPFGNPQNLYLYSYYDIPTGVFLRTMLPPFLLSGALVLLGCLCFPRDALTVPRDRECLNLPKAAPFFILFCLAAAMVLRAVPYQAGLLIIVIALLVLDRRALAGVDWSLLVTFGAFFTFSGNLARIGPVRDLFVRLLDHGTMVVAALTSQVISNVPAAILLSRFTGDYSGLLLGVNIGGAGTLVASLAGLITFREFMQHQPRAAGRFLALFSGMGFGLLFLLLTAMYLLGLA